MGGHYPWDQCISLGPRLNCDSRDYWVDGKEDRCKKELRRKT